MVEHGIIDPVARVRFPPKLWDFFSIICYALLRLSCRKTMLCARLKFHVHVPGHNHGSKAQFKGSSGAFVTYCNILTCPYSVFFFFFFFGEGMGDGARGGQKI